MKNHLLYFIVLIGLVANAASYDPATNPVSLMLTSSIPKSPDISTAAAREGWRLKLLFLKAPTNTPSPGNLLVAVDSSGTNVTWGGSTNAVGTITSVDVSDPLYIVDGGPITNVGTIGIYEVTSTNAGIVGTNLYVVLNAKEPAIATNTADTVWHGDKVFRTLSYTNLGDVPTEFNPIAHTQAMSTITGLETALTNKQTNLNLTLVDKSHYDTAYDFSQSSPAATNGTRFVLYNASISIASNYVAKGNGSNLIASAIYDAGGFVGFGTNDPKASVDVVGTVRSISHSLPASGTGVETYYHLPSDSAYFVSIDRSSTTFKPLRYYGSIHSFMEGSLGIDTLDPTNKLDVRGNISLTGTLYGPDFRQDGNGVWDYRFTGGTSHTNWAYGDHGHSTNSITNLTTYHSNLVAVIATKEPTITAGPSTNVIFADKSNGPQQWTNVAGKPSTFPPDTHSQAWSTITNVTYASAGTSGILSSTNFNTFAGKQSALGVGAEYQFLYRDTSWAYVPWGGLTGRPNGTSGELMVYTGTAGTYSNVAVATTEVDNTIVKRDSAGDIHTGTFHGDAVSVGSAAVDTLTAKSFAYIPVTTRIRFEGGTESSIGLDGSTKNSITFVTGVTAQYNELGYCTNIIVTSTNLAFGDGLLVTP